MHSLYGLWNWRRDQLYAGEYQETGQVSASLEDIPRVGSRHDPMQIGKMLVLLLVVANRLFSGLIFPSWRVTMSVISNVSLPSPSDGLASAPSASRSSSARSSWLRRMLAPISCDSYSHYFFLFLPLYHTYYTILGPIRRKTTLNRIMPLYRDIYTNLLSANTQP